MTAWWSATNKTMKRFSFIAAALLCFVTMAGAAIRPAQPGIGGGGSAISGSITLATNANQFGASTTLTIKDGVLLTNATIATAVVSGSLNSQGDTTLSGSSGITANRVMYLDISKKIQTSATVTDTELGYLDNVTSSIQTQLDSKVATNGTAVIATGTLVATNGVTIPGSTSPGELQLNGTNGNAAVIRAAASNSIPVTNVVGLIHRAAAAYIAVDCNREQDVQITNRLTGNTIVNWQNAAQGQTYQLRVSGASGSDYFVTNLFPSSWAVVAQTNVNAAVSDRFVNVVNANAGAEYSIRAYRHHSASNYVGVLLNIYAE